MPSKRPVLLWLRRNLRLEDNLVLNAAAGCGSPVIPVFIWNEDPLIGSASRWRLCRSVKELQIDFLRQGSRLIFRKGDPLKVLSSLIKETGAEAVFWDKSFEPVQRKRDEIIRRNLSGAGIRCEALNDSLLFDPAGVLNKQGTPFKVFTPFWSHCLSIEEPSIALGSRVKLSVPASWPSSQKLEDLRISLNAKWTSKMASCWKPGARGASIALKKFLSGKIEDYPSGRDCPAESGTSRLSPHLHFGEISVRKIWREIRRNMARDRRSGMVKASEAFLRQLVWREFAASLLFHFPETVLEPLRKEFRKFSWKRNARMLRAWQEGRTGYPMVDAGMRELWGTGWMHNRVRMVAASFLVKDLLQPWQDGAAWFMETLVDADLANNTFGWQWVAGCGADAAPYFRIFNPVLQGEKFDPRGDYVRRWIPELAKLPDRWIHKPWLAPYEVLDKSGVRLGKDYPVRVVDHDNARKRALFAYDRLRSSPSRGV